MGFSVLWIKEDLAKLLEDMTPTEKETGQIKEGNYEVINSLRDQPK